MPFFFYAIILIKRGEIVEEELYQAAVDSRRRYKEEGETLSDFDDFMNEIEK